jgi:hypothetical protein
MCCKKRRGLLPGNVLVCSQCDFDHGAATVIPNEHLVKDAPENVWFIYTDGRMGNA